MPEIALLPGEVPRDDKGHAQYMCYRCGVINGTFGGDFFDDTEGVRRRLCWGCMLRSVAVVLKNIKDLGSGHLPKPEEGT